LGLLGQVLLREDLGGVPVDGDGGMGDLDLLGVCSTFLELLDLAGLGDVVFADDDVSELLIGVVVNEGGPQLLVGEVDFVLFVLRGLFGLVSEGDPDLSVHPGLGASVLIEEPRGELVQLALTQRLHI